MNSPGTTTWPDDDVILHNTGACSVRAEICFVVFREKEPPLNFVAILKNSLRRTTSEGTIRAQAH
jgi:hypothetical protein